MAKPGPKPTNIKLLKARGSWRGNERENEPEPPKGLPVPPRGLDAEGWKVWKRVVPMIAEMGILGRSDAETLARYCRTVVKWWETEKFLIDNGMDTEERRFDKDGNCIWTKDVDRPQVARALKLGDECRKLENLFGLNPGARAGLATPVQKDPNENRGKSRLFVRKGKSA